MQAADTALPHNESRRWLSGPDAHWLTVPLMAFLITRLLVIVCAYATDLVPGTASPAYASANISAGVLNAWARWDSNWYVNVVEQGYSYVEGGESNIAFFPLYPFLTSLVSPLIGNTLAAGMLVNNLLFLGGLLVFYRLAYYRLNPSDARRAVFYLAASPGALFFTTAYTEGTYLLLTVSAAYLAWRRAWIPAAVCAALSAVTRVQGFLIWLVVGLEWLSAHGWTIGTMHRSEAWRSLWQGIRSDFLNLLAICLIMPSLLLAYLAHLGTTYGDPLIFQRAVSSGWGSYEVGIFRPVQVIIESVTLPTICPPSCNVIPGFQFLDLVVFLGILAMSVAVWRRFGAGYGLYCMAYVIIQTFGYLEGMFRYAAVLFPLYLVLAEWGRKPRRDLFLRVTFLVLQGILTALFVKWIFVG
jgi:hypothetical protein